MNMKKLGVALLSAAMAASMSIQAFAEVKYGPGMSSPFSPDNYPGGGSSSPSPVSDYSSPLGPGGSSSPLGSGPAGLGGTNTASDPNSASSPFAGASTPFNSVSSPFAGASTPFNSVSSPFVGESTPFNSVSSPFASTDASPTGSTPTANTVYNTDLSSCASSVTVDPIMGAVPFLHFQILTTGGSLTDGCTTNMGAFNSPTDGISGLKMRIENGIGDIYYRIYTDAHGWSQWIMNDTLTPYSGDSAKVTAIQVRGNGHTRNLYDIYYRAVLNDGSVLGWAHDGQSSGTIGTGKYIQRLQFALWPKGAGFNQSTGNRFLADNDEGVVIGADGIYHYSSWNGQPYTGWGYDTNNNKYYFENSNVVTGWKYIDGYKYYFDAFGRVVTDLEPIIGILGDYQIKINKTLKTMTIYGKDGDNGYIMPVKVILNTIGPQTPIGTYTTYQAYRWKFMHDNIYCQFLLRFKSGFLLHSIIYKPEPSSYSLDASTYNYLGKNQSDGCVRMKTGDAYWVYTNCGVGTKVTIYEDKWSPGPFDRPAIQQGIPFDQKYDPTDPVVLEQLAQDASAAAAAQQEAATGTEAQPDAVDQGQ